MQFGNMWKGFAALFGRGHGDDGRHHQAKEADRRRLATTAHKVAQKTPSDKLGGAFGKIGNKGRSPFRLLGTLGLDWRKRLKEWRNKPVVLQHQCRYRTVSKVDGVRLLVECRECHRKESAA